MIDGPWIPQGEEQRQSAAAGAADLARRLADAVQELVQQLETQERQRQELEQRLAHAEEQAAAGRDQYRALQARLTSSVSEDDLQAVRPVLEKLAGDPNHIMVLAAVAQHAPTLLQVVTTYRELRNSLR